MTDAAISSSPDVCESRAVPDIVNDVAFVILSWNERDETLRCLSSIEAAGYSMGRVVLWDNGSVDGTEDAVRSEFAEVIYHRHPRNEGVASGRNAAAAMTRRVLNATHLMFLDNDMVVTPGLLEKLAKPFANCPDQAQTMAKILFQQDPERLQSAGGQRAVFALGLKHGIGYGEIDKGQYDKPRDCLPSGGATLVSSSVFFELGGFDATFDPFGAEDLDFSYRVKAAGYQATYVPDAVLFHDYVRKSATEFGGASYIAKRVTDWFKLLHRHATLAEKVAFYAGGGLIGLIKVVIRQLRKREPAALAGIRTIAGRENAAPIEQPPGTCVGLRAD